MAKQKTSDQIVASFKEHIENIDAIPVNIDGNPNLSALARGCGFERGRFRTNPGLVAALKDAINEKGLAAINSDESHEDKRLRRSRNEIKSLRERIDVMQEQLKAKHARIQELENALAEQDTHSYSFERSAELFLDTGRMPR